MDSPPAPSLRSVLRFAVPSLLSLLLFLVPFPVNGGSTILVSVLDLGAPRPHGCERRVARCIQERQRLPLNIDLVSADMLRYSTGLARDNLGLADRVQKRGLSMVDMAHDGYDR